MTQERPDQMTPQQAMQIIRDACELAGEAPAADLSLDGKVAIASARNIVEAVFNIGMDAIAKRGQEQNVKPSPKLGDESQPGETPADTIRRRAKEEATKQKDERLKEPKEKEAA